MVLEKNKAVKFKRNSVIVEDSTIISFVTEEKILNKKVVIIESLSFGWTPSEGRRERFGLDANKKYLFVKEDELTEI